MMLKQPLLLGREVSAVQNLQLAPELSAVCARFMEAFSITDVGYTKFCSDGKRIIIETSQDFMHSCQELSLEAEISNFRFYLESFQRTSPNKIYNYLLPCETTDPLFNLLHQHNICHGISFFIRGEGEVEVVHLASYSLGVKATEFYINDLPTFHEFARFVCEQMKTKQLQHYEWLQINPLAELICTPIIPDFAAEDAKKFEFEILTPPLLHEASCYVMTQAGEVRVSSREQDCLSLLVAGFSIKEVARMLMLSPRTIESYVNNLRYKTGATSKQELIRIGFDHPGLLQRAQKFGAAKSAKQKG
jgi:DNA-binding CsgD family transcriptional regulator